jgi:hypothetical protein
MKNLILILFTLLTFFKSSAQAVVPENVRATNTLERLQDLDGLGLGDMLYGIPQPPGKVIGDTYLNTRWKQTSMLLYDNEKLLEGYPVRYDIKLDELEVKTRNGIKVLKGAKVKSFVWIDSLTNAPEYFVNAKDYKNDDNVPYTGFFQVLNDGVLPLLRKTVLDIKKADYNIQLNVGSHDDKILKKPRFYTVKDKQLIDLPSSKKKLVSVFDDQSDEMEKYIRENNLATNKADDLKLIFIHYNSLVVN